MTSAAGEWVPVGTRKPTLHTQVLVSLRGGAGLVCDVACYTGRQSDGAGGTVERWIMADIRLETRQITHWAEIFGPDERGE